MTQLELQQRGLLDLIKGRGSPSAEPYLMSVASSKGLCMIQEIAVWERREYWGIDGAVVWLPEAPQWLA
jgi:hypothetical protein